MQIEAPDYPTPPPATIAASGSWVSGIIFGDGYQVLTLAVQMTQAGTLKITRYVDRAGNFPRPVSSTAIVANTALIVDITDNLPWVSFQIEIDNSGGSTATLTNFSVLMNAD